MDCIIEGDNGLLIEPSALVVPSTPSYSTISPYWVVEFLRKSFLDKSIVQRDRPAAKRIFIS